MKKYAILLLLGMALSIHPVSALEATAWEYQQPFGVSATGITRLELPPETLNVPLVQLQDLRLIPTSGGEVPYLVERFSHTPPREAGVWSFKSSLMEGSTVLDLETGSIEPIEAVTIDSPAPDFIRAARVEGSQTTSPRSMAPLIQQPLPSDSPRRGFSTPTGGAGAGKPILNQPEEFTSPFAVAL